MNNVLRDQEKLFYYFYGLTESFWIISLIGFIFFKPKVFFARIFLASVISIIILILFDRSKNKDHRNLKGALKKNE